MAPGRSQNQSQKQGKSTNKDAARYDALGWIDILSLDKPVMQHARGCVAGLYRDVHIA
eukprot:SAG31_NODE_893_length_11177_cov_10.241806_5_plen_58_part_00